MCLPGKSVPGFFDQGSPALTEGALREWVKRADMDAGKGPPGALTTAEREELTRLRHSIDR